MAIYAVKGNREEVITEDLKEKYLAAGYDIIEDGKYTPSPAKKVTHAEYIKILDETNKLKSENKKLKAKIKALQNENKGK